MAAMLMRLCCMALLLISPAAFATAPEVSLQPASAALDSGSTIAVTVRVDHPNALLRAAMNSGKLEGPDNPNAQERHFTWVPPAIRFPFTALLVFWVEEPGVAPELALASIPLTGRTTLDIHTEPGALVEVRLAGVTFGPKRADKRGRAEVAIEVPPGVETAEVVAEAHGRLTTKATALAIPPGPTLAAAFSPDPIVEGEPAWLIVASPRPLDPKQLHVDLGGAAFASEGSGPASAVLRIRPKERTRTISAAVWWGEAANRTEATAQVVASAQTRAVGEPPSTHSFSASASAGGFYAGGSNSGGAVAIDGSYSFAGAGGRVSLDLEVGLRGASLSAPVPPLGALRSSIAALTIEVALRALAFERGRWAIYGRVGGGPVPFRVSARSDFQPSFTQSGLTLEAFAAAQVAYRLRPLEFFAELRGGLAPARTSTLDAQLGGALLAIGARYQIR
jgi:hypothetical protein